MTVIDMHPGMETVSQDEIDEMSLEELRDMVMRLAGAFILINEQLGMLSNRMYKLETRGRDE
jgi:hypothetical protein